MKKKLVALCLCASLLVGCSANQLITALEGVQIATTVASVGVPVLCSTGVIPAVVCGPITGYIAAAGIAASKAAAELKTGDTNAIKVSVIIGIFASVTVPILPPGADPRVGAYIMAIDGAIRAFLAVLGPVPRSVAGAPEKARGVLRPNFFQRHKLDDIIEKADKAAADSKRF